MLATEIPEIILELIILTGLCGVTLVAVGKMNFEYVTVLLYTLGASILLSSIKMAYEYYPDLESSIFLTAHVSFFDIFKLHALTVFIHIFIMSCSTFSLYMYDKLAEIEGEDTEPDNTFYVFVGLGGTLGAILGRRMFRHKIDNVLFNTRFQIIITVQLGLLSAYALALLL